MARDIPIIFSGEMVRALLDRRKTMTRRLAWRPARKGEPTGEGSRLSYVLDDNGVTGNITKHQRPSQWQRLQPGDRLWVRESLKHITSDPVSAEPTDVFCYMADIPPGMDCANPYEAAYLFPEDGEPHLKQRSTPSIHMPRWASRLTLIVSGVKVERLQNISEADAQAEGVKPIVDHGTGSLPYLHRIAFEHLWMRLHGDTAWIENPFVVAVSFRVIRANIDGPEALAA